MESISDYNQLNESQKKAAQYIKRAMDARETISLSFAQRKAALVAFCKVSAENGDSEELRRGYRDILALLGNCELPLLLESMG